MSLKKYKSKDNFPLVTDQPGRQIFIIGIIMSITLGFILRGLTSSNLIHQKLQEATRALGPTTTISWSQANFSFRRGILIPQLSVRVENVRLVSGEACWGEPILFTKLIELPLSITGWLSQGQPIQKIILKESFLELRSDFKCQANPIPIVEVKTTNESTAKSVRIKSKAEGVSRPPVVISDFQFEGVKIRNSKWTLSDWNLKNLRLLVEENQPWYVTLTSNFVIPETDGVDSNVALKAIYKEFPSPILDVSMKGHWREGNFNVAGNWNKKTKQWNLKTQFVNFPFQFLKILALKTKTPWNWPDRPMWFSFISESTNSTQDWKTSQHLLRDISIEGDLGELKTPDLRIVSLQPFQVSPFVFRIDKVDLETSFQAQFQRTQEIQNLGFLTGQGEWISQQELRFRGDWSQSEWSLKNRWPQLEDFLIQNSEVQAQLVKGQWTINVLNPELNGQKMTGEIELQGSQGLQNGKIKANLVSENLPFRLANQFKVLNSQNFKLKSEYKWNSNKTSDETVQLSLAQIELDQAQFDNFILNIKKLKDGFEFKSKADKVKIKKIDIANIQKVESLENLPSDTGVSSFNFKITNNQLSSWNFNSPPLMTSGEVDFDSRKISGQIRSKKNKYVISGTVDQPEIQ